MLFRSLEVHTQLEMNFDRQIPPWDRIEEVSGTDGLQLPTMDIDTTLRHICFHLARHGFEHGFMWLLDVKLYVDHHGDAIPWTDVFGNCEPQARPLLASTLTATSEWLGCDVPRFIIDYAYDNGWREARALIWEQMWELERAAHVLPVVAALLSGSPKKFLSYLQDRLSSWTAPIPGEQRQSGALLMAKRLRTALGWLVVYARSGAFGMSSLRRSEEHT